MSFFLRLHGKGFELGKDDMLILITVPPRHPESHPPETRQFLCIKNVIQIFLIVDSIADSIDLSYLFYSLSSKSDGSENIFVTV